MAAYWHKLEHQALLYFVKVRVLELLVFFFNVVLWEELMEEVANPNIASETYEESITQSTKREATTLKTTKTEEEQARQEIYRTVT